MIVGPFKEGDFYSRGGGNKQDLFDHQPSFLEEFWCFEVFWPF